MGVIQQLKRINKTSIIAAALAELQAGAVKEATTKLRDLYEREKKAKKILSNIQREIEDYVLELETDLKDYEDIGNGGGADDPSPK